MSKKPQLVEVSDKITRLKAKQASVESELASAREEAESLKPLLTCLRCGFQWRARGIEHPPNYCARCHSAGWNRPPKARNSRRPSDPPNPRWNGAQAEPEPATATPPTLEKTLERQVFEPGEVKISSRIERSPLTGLEPPPIVLGGLPPLPFLTGMNPVRPAPAPLVFADEGDEPQPEHSAVPTPTPDPDPEPFSEPEPPSEPASPEQTDDL